MGDKKKRKRYVEDRGEGKPRRRENNTVKEEIQKKMKIYEDVDSLRKEYLKKKCRKKIVKEESKTIPKEAKREQQNTIKVT